MAARSVPVQEFEAKCAELQRGSDAASKWLEALKTQQHALQVAKDVLRAYCFRCPPLCRCIRM